jgi:hypothetical protein
MNDKFLKVAVKSVVKTQVDILAAAKGAKKYDLVGDLVDAAWQTAKDAGLVTDVMLENAIVATLPHQADAQPMPHPTNTQPVPLIPHYDQTSRQGSKLNAVEPA